MRFSRSGLLFIAAAALVLLVIAPAAVRADAPSDVLVVESFVGPRPASADRIVGALRAELEKRGYLADPTLLKMRLERSVARPGLVNEDLTIAALAKKQESGINAWWGAQEAVALANLEGAVSLALRNPSVVARVDMLRDLLFARIQAIQGSKARYIGARKNELDVNRAAAIANLEYLGRLKQAA